MKSIAWLMVQIWFGNTYLSFAQAESFHPIFGPVLMTMFAALSNTLLLTSKFRTRHYKVWRTDVGQFSSQSFPTRSRGSMPYVEGLSLNGNRSLTPS